MERSFVPPRSTRGFGSTRARTPIGDASDGVRARGATRTLLPMQQMFSSEVVLTSLSTISYCRNSEWSCGYNTLVDESGPSAGTGACLRDAEPVVRRPNCDLCNT